jgi:sulfoxide reductase heme-binding subunit YedZ
VNVPLAGIGPSAYWYLARGTGAVALILLSASVVIGILGSVRVSAGRWPRFAVDIVHRDVSLLVMVVLVLHIVTSVLDAFAPIALTAAVIPFSSAYRSLWLGLGALAFDLMLALVITSLIRRRLGYQRWRAVHWLAYASWPIAVLHGLGTGSDSRAWWMLALTVACSGAVVAAVCVRIARAAPARPGLRMPAMALNLATPLGLAVFTLAGPLAPDWARRAGTPADLLPRTHLVETAAARPPPRASGPAASEFSSVLVGSVRQTAAPGGAIVDLALRLIGERRGRLRVRLAGAPIPGGGLSLTGSQVDLVADGLPSVMAGRIVSLQGEDFLAHVLGTSGTAFDLRVRLHIDPQTDAVSGRLAATPLGAGG